MSAAGLYGLYVGVGFCSIYLFVITLFFSPSSYGMEGFPLTILETFAVLSASSGR